MDKSINSIMMAPVEGALFSTAKMHSPQRLHTLGTNGLVASRHDYIPISIRRGLDLIMS